MRKVTSFLLKMRKEFNQSRYSLPVVKNLVKCKFETVIMKMVSFYGEKSPAENGMRWCWTSAQMKLPGVKYLHFCHAVLWKFHFRICTMGSDYNCHFSHLTLKHFLCFFLNPWWKFAIAWKKINILKYIKGLIGHNI